MTPEEKLAAEKVANVDSAELGSVLKKMSETLKANAEDATALKEAQKTAEKELREMLGGVKTSVEELKGKVSTLVEESAEDLEVQKSVYDLALKGKDSPALLARLGFKDDIDSALYKSNLHYNTHLRVWQPMKAGYGVTDQVALMNDMVFLVGMSKALKSAYSGNPIKYEDAVKGMDVFEVLKHELRRDPSLRKAMDTTLDSEWIPTCMSAQLLDDVRLQLKVAGLFRTITMPAKTGSWDVPKRGSALSAYLVSENTADSSQTAAGARTPGTTKVTFTAIKHALQVLHSYEVDEDSIVALMPFIREEIVYALANSAENAIINGDTTDPNMDSDKTAGSTEVENSFIGLRKTSENSSGDAAVDISTLSVANLRAIRKAMGIHGVDSKKLAYIVGVSGFVQMMGLEQVLTIDKIGSMATLLSGQMASFDGSPVIVSEHIREDLNASGVYDGSTKTKTIILLVNTDSFWCAEKPSGIKVETDRNVVNQQLISVASRRWDFKQVITNATDHNVVGIGYNLTS